MELRWIRFHWERREPDWMAAAVSGLAAGAVLMVIELVWAAISAGDAPWRISQLVAALTLGPYQTLSASAQRFDAVIVAAALATHYGLGVAFGLLLGQVIAGLHVESHPVTMAAIGVAFGALLYLLDFHLLTEFFPWIAELRGWRTFAAHLVFGLTAALLYWRLARRGLAQPRGH